MDYISSRFLCPTWKRIISVVNLGSYKNSLGTKSYQYVNWRMEFVYTYATSTIVYICVVITIIIINIIITDILLLLLLINMVNIYKYLDGFPGIQTDWFGGPAW